MVCCFQHFILHFDNLLWLQWIHIASLCCVVTSFIPYLSCRLLIVAREDSCNILMCWHQFFQYLFYHILWLQKIHVAYLCCVVSSTLSYLLISYIVATEDTCNLLMCWHQYFPCLLYHQLWLQKIHVDFLWCVVVSTFSYLSYNL